MAAVEAILTDLGLAETPRIVVMNKIDLVPAGGGREVVARGERGLPTVPISAQDGGRVAR